MRSLFDTGPAAAKITAILPYFGGKRTIAPSIVKELGRHAVYWEPFCGSLAVLLEKRQVNSETVNDLNGDVTNLAKVIASESWAALKDRLDRTHFSQGLFHETRNRLAAGECVDSLDRAYCFFVESWMGRNGVAGTRASNTAFCVRYTSNGGDPATRFGSAVESIESWHERLKGCVILEEDGIGVCERIEDKAGTVIYADPPYLVKGAKYRHDFADADHQRLADALARFKKTRVVVSYYDHPRLAELYRGWTVRHIDANKAMVNQGMRDSGGAVKAPEVLIINGPSYAEETA